MEETGKWTGMGEGWGGGSLIGFNVGAALPSGEEGLWCLFLCNAQMGCQVKNRAPGEPCEYSYTSDRQYSMVLFASGSPGQL